MNGHKLKTNERKYIKNKTNKLALGKNLKNTQKTQTKLNPNQQALVHL